MDQTANHIFRDLNEAQIDAVRHFTGPLLVIAGAGSGKTRALTHRIANLIETHNIDPYNILAVTFTNKAAREMKERLEILLAQKLSQNQFAQPWNTLNQADQNLLRNSIKEDKLKGLWMGTFHSLFSKLLRFDIETYQDPEGLTWNKHFSIYDESDSQSLVKEIINQELNLDPKQYEPKKIRWAISNAKNQCLSPKDLKKEAENHFENIIAACYERYKEALSRNNALDFDDLLLLPVLLLKQNSQIRDNWHRRFKHILVDEYQDTNQTQYELIKLLTTNSEDSKGFKNWDNRSIFVVGDADQSIYSFRAADFRILIGFQKDFDNDSKDQISLVKLEENYRSSSTIIEAANQLIANNTERIDKVLKPTKEKGDLISLTKCDDEISEADAITQKIRSFSSSGDKKFWNNYAILYRTNAQSRVIEQSLNRWNIPYTIFGGLRFFDRREIKDIIAYLRFLVNKSDDISLLRILNVPKRGIGKTSIQKLSQLSSQLNLNLWEIINNKETILSLIGRSSKGILEFSNLINELSAYLNNYGPAKLIQLIIEKSGYLSNLLTSATEESEERRRNLLELINAATQYQEENELGSIEGFLETAALSSEADKQQTNNRVTLMTLHNSKGLEFNTVFIAGLEQGLFPSYRSLDNPFALEEERRLCYVGFTRAKERLLLYHASERRLWGGDRETSIPSIFLSEIPKDLIKDEKQQYGGTSLRKDWHLERLPRIDRVESNTMFHKNPKNAVRRIYSGPAAGKEWKIKDKLIHTSFGKGEITHIFGKGSKISIAVKFDKVGSKILDPRLAPIRAI